MNTKQIIYNMLIENTGRAMGDSGDAYGRAWERNQGKTMQDFENEPEELWTYNKRWNELSRRVSVFHYLSELETDWICDYFNEMPCLNWDAEGVYGVSEEQWQWLNSKCEVMVMDTYNTYNWDSDLSQILQGSWLEINDETYMLLQIHGGCDARGGYTDAKLFKCEEYGMIHQYLREYMDSYDTDQDLEQGLIEAVDYDDPSITYTSEQILEMMRQNSIADDTKNN